MHYQPQTIEDGGGEAWERRWRSLNKDRHLRQVRRDYRPTPDHSYEFNSQGFRCGEFDTIAWADAVVWVGDSFTFGVGVRAEHTLPGLLDGVNGLVHVNLGRGGASNGRIAETAHSIVEYSPRAIICNWSNPSRLWSNGVDCTYWNMGLRKSTFPVPEKFKVCRAAYRRWMAAGVEHHNQTTLSFVHKLTELCGDTILHVSTGFRETADLLGQTWFEKPNHIMDYSFDGTHHSERMNRKHLKHIKPWLNTI